MCRRVDRLDPVQTCSRAVCVAGQRPVLERCQQKRGRTRGGWALSMPSYTFYTVSKVIIQSVLEYNTLLATGDMNCGKAKRSEKLLERKVGVSDRAEGAGVPPDSRRTGPADVSVTVSSAQRSESSSASHILVAIRSVCHLTLGIPQVHQA